MKQGTGATMRTFYITQNIGTAKYVVCWHDGVKTHKDGSKFYDIRTFKSKKYLRRFINALKLLGGYVQE